ncbi:hypothetical protein [Variovorax boronicumulans]|uniref:hypothetical protein n=1 Tax=Variovorax boronicumulans TaxID=436515 RepID=UPI001C55EA21
MPTLLRMLSNGTVQDIQLDATTALPRAGEIIETGLDDAAVQRMEVTEVRYVLANGTLNPVIECRPPTVGLANQGAETAR